ncbi:MAG: type II toxin-antitoxin system VapC family toxin [Mycobacteriales bacterium]
MIVVDTSILIDHLRGHGAATDLIDGALSRGERPIASEVTRIEVLAGMRSSERRQTRALLGSLEWESIDEEVAEAAGDLAGRFRHSHPGIGVADYAIAATATLRRADLQTLNVRHFPMFPDLNPAY